MGTKVNKGTVVEAVVAFVRNRSLRANTAFTTKDLSKFVNRRVECASGTPARTLRALRSTGWVDYAVAFGSNPPSYSAIRAY